MRPARLSRATQCIFTCNNRIVCLQSRCFNTGSRDDEVTNVAILGGGITGLASAFFLTKSFPKAKVTIYESGSRLGAWLRSAKIEVDGGQVVFERGPRTLRPSGTAALATLTLIHRLHLGGEVLTTSKSSPAARNRFIYYPDHLVRLPVPGPDASLLSCARTLFSEPLFKGLLGAIWNEPGHPKISTAPDESVGSFISRRLSPQVADNIVSAVFHGIYAGDIYQLSARMLIPQLCAMERIYGSVMEGYAKLSWSQQSLRREKDQDTLKQLASTFEAPNSPERLWFESISNASVYTFKGGVERLITELVDALNLLSNVTINTDTTVTSLQLRSTDQDTKVEIRAASFQRGVLEPQSCSHVISTLPSTALAKLIDYTLSPMTSFLTTNPSVTVMVVNLYYRSPSLIPYRGFGYLLSRTVPLAQNPERALGVVFDSDSSIGQDSAPGTKLTVMMGGHWWDGWSSLPDEEEGVRMAKSVLNRHLGIQEEPTAVLCTLQKDCIPQYIPGHADRMTLVHNVLKKEWKSKMSVAGSSYTGVGVNDCVRSAWELVHGLAEGKGRTGLESLAENEVWVPVRD